MTFSKVAFILFQAVRLSSKRQAAERHRLDWLSKPKLTMAKDKKLRKGPSTRERGCTHCSVSAKITPDDDTTEVKALDVSEIADKSSMYSADAVVVGRAVVPMELEATVLPILLCANPDAPCSKRAMATHMHSV
jgi:hypothetical protein